MAEARFLKAWVKAGRVTKDVVEDPVIRVPSGSKTIPGFEVGISLVVDDEKPLRVGIYGLPPEGSPFLIPDSQFLVPLTAKQREGEMFVLPLDEWRFPSLGNYEIRVYQQVVPPSGPLLLGGTDRVFWRRPFRIQSDGSDA